MTIFPSAQDTQLKQLEEGPILSSSTWPENKVSLFLSNSSIPLEIQIKFLVILKDLQLESPILKENNEMRL